MAADREQRPTEADAAAIAQGLRGSAPESVQRFSTGIGHWVYDVRMPNGTSVVVRMGTPDQRPDFEGALHWSKTLRPLGVPLPELLDHGEFQAFPYLTLQRLPGEDLGRVYASLSSAERRTVAEAVWQVQARVGALPVGTGFGFLRLPTERGHQAWHDVVNASLDRSRRRIESAGLLGSEVVERVLRHSKQFHAYFSRIRPTPFLDDITTKNVLVHAGKFSGIVDVDWLCFGDPLFTVGLTSTALLSAGHDPEYTDHWCDFLDLSAEQRRVVRFYTALFCVDFMSEFGQSFNGDITPPDLDQLAHLERLMNRQLDEIA